MEDEILPKLALRYQVAVVPKRHGNAGPRKTVEEYRINKPSQQFRKKKSYNCVYLTNVECAVWISTVYLFVRL
jgi:hypothetical protein